MKQSISPILMGLTVLFSVCLVTSNFFETKLVQFGSIITTAGILLFPISYIVNDVVAEVWGFRRARMVIWIGFAMNFLVISFCFVAVALPSAPFWEGESHFNYVFGLTPRIAVASLLAFVIGSFLNAFVMSKMKLSSHGRHFSVRAVASTLVGESADSLIFFPIAFYGIVPNNELMIMVLTQAGMKTLYEIIVLPLTNVIVRVIKEKERTDVYDKGIKYNIFGL
ncbi:queuosine precursor transporter [Porphyromonadaceae bacterium]